MIKPRKAAGRPTFIPTEDHKTLLVITVLVEILCMETDAITKFLQKIRFFKVFNDKELFKLVGRQKIFKNCNKGEYIFKEGDDGSSLFVILFGTLQLVKSRENHIESIILELKTGTVFGEVAMLTKNKRNLDARASSDKVVVMEFKLEFVEKMLPSIQTKFHKQLLYILATNLDTMNMRYAKLEASVKMKEQLVA